MIVSDLDTTIKHILFESGDIFIEYGLTSAVQKRLKFGKALPAGQETNFRHLLYGEEVKWPYKKKGTVCMDKE